MSDPRLPLPSIAYASVRDTERVFLAENVEVLARVLAVTLVADLDPKRNPAITEIIRAALLEERWADALVAYMEETGTAIDIFDNEPVWTDRRMSLDDAFIDIRMSRIFRTS